MSRFVPHDAHELVARSAFDVQHLTSLQSHEARMREIKRNSEAWHTEW
jgi:hypothetical protein